jgi:predicted enzyme related to lactoylglutathione lyase
MVAPVVFFDIAGPDARTQADFYFEVFDWKIGTDGRFNVPTSGNLQGALRQDPAEKVLYLGVADVTACLAKVEAQGGIVIQPRFEVPGSSSWVFSPIRPAIESVWWRWTARR